MLHLHRIHRRHLSRARELTLVGLFIAIGLACVDTVWAMYMNQFGLSNSAIGYISSGLVVLALIISFLCIPLLEYFKQTKILALSMIVSIASYFIIGIFPHLSVFLFIATLLTAAGVFRVVSFDIIFRDNTSDHDLNKEEGFMYMLLNVGWLVGPLIAGFFILRLGMTSVFFVAGGFYFMALLLFFLIHAKNIAKKHNRLDINFFANMRDFVTDKKLRLPYVMATGIEVWWALVYIYIPLFMLKEGFAQSSVGFFMATLIIPLVLIEQWVGHHSLRLGFRPFFFIGFAGLALLSLVLALSSSIILQLVLIVLGSFFVGCLEPIQDTFFFKQIAPKNEERYYPLFRTSADVGGFIGKFVVATVLLFLPYHFAYVSMFFMMVLFAYKAFTISKDLR